MKVLITGAGGFLGKGLVVPFEEHGHVLRLMDVRAFESRHETVVGDVADLATVLQAMQGMDALVVAHMAPRDPDAYATPERSFDINVKGTANLLFAAQLAGVRKVVLISSTSVVQENPGPPWQRGMPRCAKGMYGLTKVCQEVIAEQYSREHGMAVAILRVGYILDGDRMVDKYGRQIRERAPLDTDRRDIGDVARLCLERDDTALEIMHVMSTREAMKEWDMEYTCRRLGWQPRYDFDCLPTPVQKQGN